MTTDSGNLRNRRFPRAVDFSAAEIHHLLDLAAELKPARSEGVEVARLVGRRLAPICEKNSTRTRRPIETAAAGEDATTHLGPAGSRPGRRETVADTARMYHGIGYRGFARPTARRPAEHAGLPAYDGLTDECHPAQSLCDVFTMREHLGRPPAEISFCYLGDARRDTANSLASMGSLLGMDVRIAAPRALWPGPLLVAECLLLGERSGAGFTLTEDVAEAVQGADFLCTDAWAPTGEGHDGCSERIAQLLPYQVNARTMAATGNPDTAFLPCLPALHDRRYEPAEELGARHCPDALEVTDEVLESPASLVLEQVENRMHTIKAVLFATLLGG